MSNVSPSGVVKLSINLMMLGWSICFIRSIYLSVCTFILESFSLYFLIFLRAYNQPVWMYRTLNTSANPPVPSTPKVSQGKPLNPDTSILKQSTNYLNIESIIINRFSTLFPTMQQKNTVCQYYLRGKCRFGSSCRFFHSTQVQPKQCEYFIQGRCKHTNDCVNIHDGVKYDVRCFAVRHGESEFNLRLQQFAEKNNNVHCEEAKEFQFDESLIDADLTELGREQSRISRDRYQKKNIQMIFVSPLNRALETCDIIFNGKKIEIVVIPEFSEILSMVCDVSKPISQKVAKYKHMNFSLFDELDNNWQVPSISLPHQIPFQKITSPQESMDEIFGFMKTSFPVRLESDQDCRMRVIRGMAKMKKICKEKGIRQVAIVAHRRVIRELSKNYNEKYGVGLENAEVVELNL